MNKMTSLPTVARKSAKILSLLCLLLSFQTFSQIESSAAGGDFAGAGGNCSFTVGQVCDEYLSASGANASQGVQQPFEIFVAEIAEIDHWGLRVFPNPTAGMVTIELGNFAEGLELLVENERGQIVWRQRMEGPQKTLDFNAFETGVYFVRIHSREGFYPCAKVVRM
jgi:hypothetical protein